MVADIADDKLGAKYSVGETGRKVVEGNDRFTAGGQLLDDMAADVAGAAGYEDGIIVQENSRPPWIVLMFRGQPPLRARQGGQRLCPNI